MKKIILLLILSVPTFVMSQQVMFDLSKDKLEKQNISPGTKELILQNVLSKKKNYKISFQIINKPNPIPAILPDPFTAANAGGKAETNGEKDQPNLNDRAKCANGPDIIKEINDVKNTVFVSEVDLKKAYVKVKGEINKLTDPCQTEALDLLHEAELSISSKSFLKDVKTCQIVYLTIERYSNDATPKLEKIWEDTLETDCEQKQSRWLIYYGFTYQPNIISKYDQFYSKADTSNANKFTVTKKNGNQTKFWENLSPTIMFTYLLGEKQKDLKFGVSAITATNFTTYSAGVGVSAIIGYNLNLSSGIMFTQKNVLNGQYKEGDIIKTNLTYDQLHEKKWGPEIYFTIGLRFDKNPFGGGSSDKSSTNKNPTDKNSNSPAKDSADKK